MRFNRINPNRSIPTTKQSLESYQRLSKFQSYQSKQINPDRAMHFNDRKNVSAVSIVSIQTDQSRPRLWMVNYCCDLLYVSIVSIQTDQSRRGKIHLRVVSPDRVSIVSIQTDQSRPIAIQVVIFIAALFQSYQSKQINPDHFDEKEVNEINEVSIVSIQTDQSRRFIIHTVLCLGCTGFNRINPNRSIPTWIIRIYSASLAMFQSYQSKQINPDLSLISY